VTKQLTLSTCNLTKQSDGSALLAFKEDDAHWAGDDASLRLTADDVAELRGFFVGRPEAPADGLAGELERLDQQATPSPFYELGSPWANGRPAIMAESPDPHVARFIADFDMTGLVDDEDKLSEQPDADAALLVWLRNHVPEILAALQPTADSTAPSRDDVEADLEACERAIDRMGWPEINAFYREPPQGPYEDAGGGIIRRIKSLFGIKNDPVESYKEACRRMVAEAWASNALTTKGEER